MSSMESKKPRHYWPTKIIVALWLLGVLAYAYHRQPEFWMDAVDHYREATRLASAGHWSEANSRVDRAIKMSPGTGGFLILKGDIETALGNAQGALDAYQEAFQADVSNPEAWFALSRAYARIGDSDKALKLILRLAPEQVTLTDRIRRAKILAQYGLHSEALTDLHVVLAQRPLDVDVLRETAVLEEADKQHLMAAGRYETIAQLQGETADLCARIGTLYRWAGKPDAAVAWYLKALRNPPGSSASNAVVRGLTAAGVETADSQSVLPWARMLMANNPTDPEALSLAIRAFMRAGAPAEAVSAFDRLAALRPLTVAEQLLQAGQCRTAGDADRATALLKALPEDTLTAEQRVERLRILTSAGAAEAAIRESETLLATKPAPELERELLRKLAEMNGVLRRYEVSAGWYQKLAGVETNALWARDSRLAAAAALRAGGRAEQAYAAYGRDAAIDNLQARAELAMELRRYAEAEPLLLELVKSPFDPQDDPRMLNDLATVYEMKKEYAKAIPLVQDLLARKWGDRIALTLRLAEIQRWNGQFDDAVKSYRQALTGAGSLTTPAQYGLALACLELGQGREALDALKPLLDQQPASPDYLLAAARAASTIGDAAQAADFLDRLAKVRPLSRAEKIWLAGQDRQAGRKDKALPLYRELAQDPAAERSVLEAWGDLSADAGDQAGALLAFQRIGGAEQDPDLVLKMARVARDSADNVTLALKYYDQLLTNALGQIPEIQLEAARFFVNVRREPAAYVLYTNAAAVKSWDGQPIELMRAALAANLFPEAEKWAQARLDQDDQDWRAQLGLVQALHLQGKTRDAAQILEKHKGSISQQTEGLEWLGLVAMARDRHLEAFRIFDGLAQDTNTTQRRYWIWRGRSAQAMGDRQAANESYQKAADLSPKTTGDGKGEEESADRQLQQIRGAGNQ
jgi:predicted Zn-dependent protease